MLLPLGSLGDPLGQPLDLLFRQFVRRIHRRHPQRFIFCRDAAHQLALLRMAADDGSPALSQIGEGVCFGIEPQAGSCCSGRPARGKQNTCPKESGRMSRLKSTRRVEAALKGAVFCKALAGGSANAAKPNAQAAHTNQVT